MKKMSSKFYAQTHFAGLMQPIPPAGGSDSATALVSRPSVAGERYIPTPNLRLVFYTPLPIPPKGKLRQIAAGRSQCAPQSKPVRFALTPRQALSAVQYQ